MSSLSVQSVMVPVDPTVMWAHTPAAATHVTGVKVVCRRSCSPAGIWGDTAGGAPGLKSNQYVDTPLGHLQGASVGATPLRFFTIVVDDASKAKPPVSDEARGTVFSGAG